jgi:very-short-patch-repair endonuclease
MRQHPTSSEARLWRALSGSRLGVAFRRQVVIDRYIVDFLAPAVRLVIEVDGGIHESRTQLDNRRDARLSQLGYRTLRIPAQLVTRNPAAAATLVQSALQAR